MKRLPDNQSFDGSHLDPVPRDQSIRRCKRYDPSTSSAKELPADVNAADPANSSYESLMERGIRKPRKLAILTQEQAIEVYEHEFSRETTFAAADVFVSGPNASAAVTARR